MGSSVVRTRTCANPACALEFTARGKYCSTACWAEVDPSKRYLVDPAPFVDPDEVGRAEDDVDTALLALDPFVRRMTGPDATVEDARRLQILSEAVVRAIVVRDRLKGRPWTSLAPVFGVADQTLKKRYDRSEGTNRRA